LRQRVNQLAEENRLKDMKMASLSDMYESLLEEVDQKTRRQTLDDLNHAGRKVDDALVYSDALRQQNNALLRETALNQTASGDDDDGSKTSGLLS